ncbi:MAG: TonB family protein, partial [Candidatus Binataceae bacterium]
MRSCPRCGKTYPDSEVFCEADGTALVQAGAAGRATTVMPESGAAPTSTPAECPTCGGKAEPGEVICNFCGTRLVPEGAQPAPSQPSGAPTQHTRDPQTFVPASDWISSGMTRGADASQGGAAAPEGDGGEGAGDGGENSGGRGAVGIIGYALAAIIALGAGAWLALHFTEHHPRAPIAQASASPTPGLITGPSVQLASSIPIEVSGGANVPGRDTGAMAQAFAKNKAGLLDTYTHALAANAKLEDGMIVRLHIMPDGSVSSGTVRVSTAGDPGLDAAVIKTMNAWDFTPASGGGAVDADFPVIFANQPADVATLSSDLGTKLAKLSPDEAPEFSSALPSPGPT